MKCGKLDLVPLKAKLSLFRPQGFTLRSNEIDIGFLFVDLNVLGVKRLRARKKFFSVFFLSSPA